MISVTKSDSEVPEYDDEVPESVRRVPKDDDKGSRI